MAYELKAFYCLSVHYQLLAGQFLEFVNFMHYHTVSFVCFQFILKT